MSTNTVETIESLSCKARSAIADLEGAAMLWRLNAKHREQELTRQREGENKHIDGQGIEYWHQIATSTLKTNNELIDRVKEKECERACLQVRLEDATHNLRTKERINADLEQQLKSAEIAAAKQRETIAKLQVELEVGKHRTEHQRGCAKFAQNERDAALRELDAMREKMNCTATPSILDSILARLDALEHKSTPLA